MAEYKQPDSSSEDSIRQNVNNVYGTFNADCGEGAKSFAAPMLVKPAEEDDFIRLNTNPAFGVGFWDVLRLQEDLLVCVAEGVYADPFIYGVSPGEDIVTLRMIVSGEIEFRSNEAVRNRYVHIPQGTASILSMPEAHDSEFEILERQPLASVTMHFHAGRFSALMGFETDEMPPMLHPFQHNDGKYNYCSMPLTQAMTRAVFDMVKAPYQGSLRRRYFQAKSTELLCLFVDAAQQNSEYDPSSSNVRRRNLIQVQDARRLLLQNFVEAPAVEQLARAVGLNRTELRREFKALYGVTIAEFLLKHRMEHAWRLLQNKELSVKAVANAVGYAHAGNFSAAFRRCYGVSPKDIRRA